MKSYHFFDIHKSSDERKRVGDLPMRAEFIVFAHNGFIHDDQGGRFKDGAVIYTTPLGDYDGGFEVCEAFVDGTRSTQTVGPVTMVSSSGFEMEEPFKGERGVPRLDELSDNSQNEDPE